MAILKVFSKILPAGSVVVPQTRLFLGGSEGLFRGTRPDMEIRLWSKELNGEKGSTVKAEWWEVRNRTGMLASSICLSVFHHYRKSEDHLQKPPKTSQEFSNIIHAPSWGRQIQVTNPMLFQDSGTGRRSSWETQNVVFAILRHRRRPGRNTSTVSLHFEMVQPGT